MPILDFASDWVDAEGINDPELSATWASLRIRAGDSIITHVLDTRARTVRDFVYVPLYPLAEWLATNWWFLRYEFENPAKREDPAFRRRHALGANREGYAFPNLEVVSSGARTHLVWTADRPTWTGIEFLASGNLWIDSREFFETCADLVDRVVRRLASFGLDDTFLQEEWTAIQAADSEESEFCKTVAGLGWDPYALDDPDRDWVFLFAEKLRGMLDEAIPATNVEGPSEDWLTFADTIPETRRRNSLPLRRVRSVSSETLMGMGTGLHPWDLGYESARRLRRSLGLDGQPLPTMARVAQALDEDAESIEKVTTSHASPGGWPVLVDGVITRNDDGTPALAFRRMADAGRRFHFCRALAEVCASPGTETLLTRAQSERQQRNRAFAAEFLAPASGLKQRVSRPVVDGEDIDELAVEFGVSSRVIEHQIRNHQIARVW